jgi:predicted SnoaL-like aldol condensation-catalyzing enzyme
VTAEGDMVALHTTYEKTLAFGADMLLGFDVFRVEEGHVRKQPGFISCQAPSATANGWPW